MKNNVVRIVSKFNYNNCIRYSSISSTYFDVSCSIISCDQFFSFLFFFFLRYTMTIIARCCLLYRKRNSIRSIIAKPPQRNEDIIIYEPYIILHNVSMVIFICLNLYIYMYMVKAINFHRKCFYKRIYYLF